MEQFLKSEIYYRFIKELDRRVEFYDINYSNPFSQNKFTLHMIESSAIHALASELNKIRLTTLKTELFQFNDMFLEIRENVIKRIKLIPNDFRANEIYIINYEAYIIDWEKDPMFLVHGIDGYPELRYDKGKEYFVYIRDREQLEAYKKGKSIEAIEMDEITIAKLGVMFDFDRSKVNPNIDYEGVNILRGNQSFNITKLANELIEQGYLGKYHLLPFSHLLSGKNYYEPIQWKSNLSDLNRLIKSLYSQSNKPTSTNPIEWKAISTIFTINGNFLDPNKLKGASTIKIDNIPGLQPFIGYCKRAKEKDLPT